MRGAIWAWLLLASACEDGSVRVALPSLAPDIVYAALILQAEDGHFTSTTPLLERAHDRFEYQIEADELGPAEQIRLLGYRASSLAHLLDVSTPNDARISAATTNEAWLPRPDLDVEGPLDGELLPTDRELPPLTASWLPACSGEACDFHPLTDREHRITLEPGIRDHGKLLLPWRNGSSSALVGTKGGRFYRVTSTTSTALTDLRAPWLGNVDAFLAPDDTMWVGTDLGALYRGRPETGFEEVARLPEIEDVQIDGSKDGAPFELFIASKAGTFARFDGENLEILWQSPRKDELPVRDSGVAWVAPGQAIAIFDDLGQIVRSNHGEIVVDDLVEPNAIALVPGLGAVVGSALDFESGRTELYVDDNGRWVLLSDVLPGDPFKPLSIWPTGEREFLYGGLDGHMAYYRSGLGGCRFSPYEPANINGLIEIGSEILMVYDNETEGDDTTVRFVERRLPNEPSCGDFR